MWRTPATNLLEVVRRQDIFYCPDEYYLFKDNGPPDAWTAFPDYVVTGYIWLFPNAPSLNSTVLGGTNMPPKITDARPWPPGYNVASTEMIVDATISVLTPTGGRRYVGIGGAGGTTVRTAHMENSGLPAGGNVCFRDNHIEWRRFQLMTNIISPPGLPAFQF